MLFNLQKEITDENNYYENNVLKEITFLNNTINSIYGPSGIGKTTLAYSLIKEELQKNKKIIYIDTEKSFSKKRFLDIIGDLDKYKKNNFLKINIISFKQLNDFLRKLELRNHLLIVDSLSMPYRLELKDNFEEINKELAKTLNILLNKLDENSKILLINHSYYKEDELNIVGGDLIKYYSKVLVSMYFEVGDRKITLVKHKYLPNKTFYFKIKREGLFKKGVL